MINPTKPKKFLKRTIDTIFLMMGNECNLNCKYCLQHPLVEHPITHTINTDIYDFIKQVCEESYPQTVDLRFWGGEPLVFFPIIKTIIEEIKLRNIPVAFSTMTNGKLLTEEIVNYFIENNVKCSLSWDGPNVLETRGYDAIKEKKDLIFKIPNLCISAVLSAKAYPKEILEAFQALDNEYYDIWKYHLSTNIDDIFDTGDLPEELLDIDYDRVSSEIFELATDWLSFITSNNNQNKLYSCKHKYISTLYYRSFKFYSDHKSCNNGIVNNMWCCCDGGYSILNMGLDGKLYPCHNTSHSIGSIYDNYFKVLKNIIKEDESIKRRLNGMCENCIAIAYCMRGCKLVPEKNMKKSFCKLKKAIYTPFLLLLNEFGNVLNQTNKESEITDGNVDG